MLSPVYGESGPLRRERGSPAATRTGAFEPTPAARDWQGAELGYGLTAYFPDEVRVEFNRSFSRSASDQYRSYSLPLRPDILLSSPHGQHIFDAEPRMDLSDIDEALDEQAGPDREHQ